MDNLEHKENVLIRLIMKANKRKQSRINNTSIETSAEIRNKLQSVKTVLEFIQLGKQLPKEMIERALKDLDEAVKKFD